MADLDFSKCEKPDAMLQLAWEAGLDRKAVIRAGSGSAGLLLASERYSLVTRFWPVPRPLEAVDHWSENVDNQLAERLRPFGSALVPGCVLGALVAHFFVAPFMSEDEGNWAMLVILVAFIIGLGFILKVVIARVLQRRVARLDETTAFEIVLDQLRQGMVASPKVVPIALTLMRRRLEALTAATPSA